MTPDEIKRLEELERRAAEADMQRRLEKLERAFRPSKLKGYADALKAKLPKVSVEWPKD